jgi:hypothetical protein
MQLRVDVIRATVGAFILESAGAAISPVACPDRTAEYVSQLLAAPTPTMAAAIANQPFQPGRRESLLPALSRFHEQSSPLDSPPFPDSTATNTCCE